MKSVSKKLMMVIARMLSWFLFGYTLSALFISKSGAGSEDVWVAFIVSGIVSITISIASD